MPPTPTRPLPLAGRWARSGQCTGLVAWNGSVGSFLARGSLRYSRVVVASPASRVADAMREGTTGKLRDTPVTFTVRNGVTGSQICRLSAARSDSSD